MTGHVLSGWALVEALSPLTRALRHRLPECAALPYDKAFEPEADLSIDIYVTSPSGSAWSQMSRGAWRVLLERHQQLINMALTSLGEPSVSVPLGLSDLGRCSVVMQILLHEMELPWPPQDRSQIEALVMPPSGPSEE